jgi:hypothetical protein
MAILRSAAVDFPLLMPHFARLCCSFEGAIAASGAPLVGYIAERYFGFRGFGDKEDSHANAGALSNALLTCLFIPWVLCLLSYTGDSFSCPGCSAC